MKKELSVKAEPDFPRNSGNAADAGKEAHDNTLDKRPPSVIELFRSVETSSNEERITIGDLLHGMEDRAAAALILIFALPNALPTPPGTSTVLGIPLLFLCTQFAVGWPVWLPRFITDRSMKRADFSALLTKAEPWLAKAERFLKPRLSVLTSYAAERLLGTLWLILAIVLVLPIPLGNMPPAVSLCIMALGLLAADGIFIILGVLAAIASLVLASSVVFGVLAAGAAFIGRFFS
ncbi:exopolysaccharide biosynthesis protein [Neorhizobium lilium]|uniref:Exopolysaccharide biosynthesis protein n=2 Tax=Neorhizobium lilium TaxID=2503024 RepID=A0A3S3RHK8_9HYPH|nr:exopolysaccharide biosynthesis protein [Neorhizobium lilium]